MKKEKLKNRNSYLLGGVGFTIVFILNLIGIFALNQDAAVFFSERWWFSWFPAYIPWIVFLIIGAGNSFKKIEGTQS
jgi:hypothetical protein